MNAMSFKVRELVFVKSGIETCGGPQGMCIHAEQKQLLCSLIKSLFEHTSFLSVIGGGKTPTIC